jgi:hypothetical protein
MFERNYCADNFLTVYFNVSYPSYLQATGEVALKAQLYLAIVAQALVVKSDISTRRARNSFGTVTWQHNEIWPTVRPTLWMENPPLYATSISFVRHSLTGAVPCCAGVVCG